MEQAQQQAHEQQQELEHREITALGDDIDGLRRWFDEDRERQQRHPDEYAALERSERSLFSHIFRHRWRR